MIGATTVDSVGTPDLYSALVQVFPVLLLAFMWESGFLTRLAAENERRQGPLRPDGVKFWRKSRVRTYTFFVAATVVVQIALCALVLAGAIPDRPMVRILVLAGLALALGTLLTRICVDLWEATVERSATEEPDEPGSG